MIVQFWAEVIADGRITIPKETRHGEGIQVGDSLKIAILEIKKGEAEKE